MGLCIINRAGNNNDSITIDDTLSSVSENPVQNKIINNALSNKVDLQSLSTVATSGSYNDLSNKPTIPVIYSGTTNPSASIGVDGNLYILYTD